MRHCFLSYLDSQMQKARQQEESMSPNKKQKVRKVLSKGSTMHCKGCGQLPTNCCNVKYGVYCKNAVRSYFYKNSEVGIDTHVLTAKKVFVDHFHYTIHYKAFLEIP